MKYLLTIVIISFCFGCKNQNDVSKTDFVKTEIIPSKIDSLKTEEDVQNFVRKIKYPFSKFREHNDSIKIYRFLEKFELKKIKDFDRNQRKDYDSLTKRIADSLNITESFYKADIDNNGFSDLIIIGDDNSCSSGYPETNSKRSCNYSVYALMNFGNDTINPVDLMRLNFSGYTIVPKIEDVNDKTSLSIFESPQYNGKKKNFKKIELAYVLGSFIEYNKNPKKFTIEKIEYEAEPCYGKCPIFELTINNDRTAVLNAIEFNSLDPNLREYKISRELKGKFKTVITNEKYQEIIDLLNYLDFPTLEDNYSIPVTDIPGSVLKITYNQGKTKIISDYGKKGTLGLIKLYDLIENLRTNQEWE